MNCVYCCSRFSLCVAKICFAMESALMAAAVSVAVDAQRAADLAAQERERYAMRAADLECLMAQRMFMEDLLLPQRFQPTTYEVGYTLRHNALVESHDAMRTVHSMLLRGRVSRALQVAEEELEGLVDAEDAEEESLDNDPPVEEESSDTNAPVEDILVEDVQTALLAQVAQPAPADAPVQAFSGRCFRLDDA